MGNKRKIKTTESSESEPAKQAKVHPEDEDHHEEPTKQEIEQSFKPENVPSVETVRDKKRGIHKKLVEKKKEISGARDSESIKSYLTKWKAGDSWKFEKKKQIYIQSHCFDPTKIHDEDWHNCLEYLEGSKGKSRELLIERAEKLISSLDLDGDMDAEATIKYNRSRDLLQMLN